MVGRDPVPTGNERQNVVIATRIAAMRELMTSTETETPTMESILEFNGPRMEPAAESTPHANTQVHNSTYEGADLISQFMDDDSEDMRARRTLAKEQTALSVHQLTHGQTRQLSQLPGRMPLPLLRGNCTGGDQGKAKAGISMEIRLLQLLLRRQPTENVISRQVQSAQLYRYSQ